MQPIVNTYQGMLQRLGQMAGGAPSSAPSYPQVPLIVTPTYPTVAPDQIMLSPSAQAFAYAPMPAPVMVPTPPQVVPAVMPQIVPAVVPQVVLPAPQAAAPQVVLPASLSNPLGIAWEEASAIAPAKAPAPSNPLGVNWLEMATPALPPAPKPEPKPEPKAEPKPAPKPEPKPEPKPAPKPEPKPAPKPPASYTVKSGDSLSQIAQATLGNSDRWREIYDLNKGVIGGNPNVIVPGMVLTLPGGAKVSAPAPSTSKAGQAPYINQYSPAGNDGSYWNGPANCGPTSMAIIARAFGYGKSMTDAKLINHLGSMGGTNGNGTNVSGIAAMARGIGKSAVTKGPGAQVDWIASELRAGKMVVANGDYHAMYPHIDNSRTSGHYVAVIGLDGSGRFLVHDPAWKNGGAPIALTRDQLASFIRANPNGGWQISIG